MTSRERKTMMNMTGAGFVTQAKKVLKAAHDHAKKGKILSKALHQAGFTKLSAVARLAGYGKRRRRRTAL